MHMKFRFLWKVCFNSFKDVDEEHEVFLKSTNVIANCSISTKQMIEVLFYSLSKNFPENMIRKKKNER